MDPSTDWSPGRSSGPDLSPDWSLGYLSFTLFLPLSRPCNVPWHVTARYKSSFYYYYYYLLSDATANCVYVCVLNSRHRCLML